MNKQKPKAATRRTRNSQATEQQDVKEAAKEAANLKSLAGDDLNRRLVELLQEDGRMPYATIAKKLGIFEGTVRKRILQLTQNNVISIVAEARPEVFGFHVQGMAFIDAVPNANLDALAQKLGTLSEVHYVARYTATHDLVIESYHRSLEDFSDFLNSQVQSLPSVARVVPHVMMKVYKLRPKWHTLLGSG